MMKKLLLLAVLACFTGYAAMAQKDMPAKKKPMHHKHHHNKNGNVRTTTHKHNIKVTQDNGHNQYEGKPTKQNDGVKQNKQRNMNYQSNTPLPPSSGNNSK